MAMKRALLFVLFASLLALVAVPAMAGGQKEAGGVTLKYMWWTPIYEPYVSAAIKVFEQKNPGIKVDYDTAAFDPYWQKIQTMYASGNPPDVFDMSIAYTWDFANKGSVLDMESYVSKNIDQYYRKAIDMERYPDINGHVFAMPYQWVASLLFYNKDLFDAAGIAYPTPDWDYETLIATAKQLTKEGQYGFFANGAHTFMDSMIKAYGGMVLSQDFKQVKLDDPIDIQVIQKVVDMIQKDKSAPVAASYEALLASGGDMFRSGKIAMTIDGSYMIDSFKAAPFKWDATMVPKGPVKRSVYGGPDGMSIAKTTKHPAEAWKFVQFMTGPDRPKETWIPGGVPITKSVATGKDWYDMHAKWLSDPKVLLDSGNYLDGADFSTKWLEWRINTMNAELAPAFVGQKSVVDAVAAAKAAVEKVLASK
jgi:multiple sugar transport system substrate-binding protein